jgi:hypothetical protein
MRRAAFVLFALYWLGSSAAFADGPSRAQTSAAEFVQRFYDWYVPLAHQDTKSPPWILALNKRGAEFDSGLSRALREDWAAQRRVHDDIVGLDFDPILMSQDPLDKYTVGNVSEEGGAYLVSVYGVQDGHRADKPSVVAELKPSKGAFIFTNFRYGADGDLLGTLKILREQRAHH